jgi:hypothetical protein
MPCDHDNQKASWGMGLHFGVMSDEIFNVGIPRNIENPAPEGSRAVQ